MNKLTFWEKMAGQFQTDTKTKIKKSLLSWIRSITRSHSSWEANNIHIDEISGFNSITRNEWINASFSVLNILLTQVKLPESLLVFLHINLADNKEKFLLENFSLHWLENNIHTFTPPSFNCTTLDYYENFYQQELIKCTADTSVLKLVNPAVKLDFFYRTYFDQFEKLYLRELYIFKAT